MHKKTETGRVVRTYLLSGDVVPDKVVFDLISEKVASAEVAHQGSSIVCDVSNVGLSYAGHDVFIFISCDFYFDMKLIQQRKSIVICSSSG